MYGCQQSPHSQVSPPLLAHSLMTALHVCLHYYLGLLSNVACQAVTLQLHTEQWRSLRLLHVQAHTLDGQ